MNKYKIAVLKGDGIGPEIVNEAIKVLNKTAEKFGFEVDYDEALLGGCAIDATGVPLPEETIAKCKAADSVLLGAVGGPKWDNQPGNNRPEAGLLGIRGALGLFANLRPAVIFEPLKNASPLKAEIIGDSMDIMIVRELTGGIYFGKRGKFEEDGVPAAYDTEKYSVTEIERIGRVAFDMAMKRNKKLTSVDKANVLDSSRLWRETIIRLSKEYPEVELSHMYVDNCAMQLLKDRILKDGIVKEGNVLKVDSFLNHQMDISLFEEIGKEFKKRFEGESINKILTIEASGIGIACIAARYFNVPVVFAKKSKTKNIAGDVYTSRVESFTHGRIYDIMVSKDFLNSDDRVLLIDDFLANGCALEGLAELVRSAGATLVGAGIVIEKGFQRGGDLLRSKGVRVESLAIIDRMDENGSITFRD